MQVTEHATESASAVAITLKSGLSGVAVTLFFSLFAVVVGFKVVPLTKGREIEDASRRLACGFLSSITVGFYSAYKFIRFDPDWLGFWLQLFNGHTDQWFLAVVAASLPFVAGSALAGFWIVAAFMRLAKDKTYSYGRTRK